MRLEGKRALVTGSSRGIGAEVARLFAEEGARVAVNYRTSRREAESVVRSVNRKGGEAFAVKGDVSSPSEVASMFFQLRRRLGGLDVLVNNAGVADGAIWNTPVPRLTLDMWNRVFSVDAFGTFLCTQAALPLMKAGSSVVNVASTPALSGGTEGIVYASAKGAVISMTRMLAKSLAPKVRVNCVAFGSIDTNWVDWLDKETRAAFVSAIPKGRFGKTREAAAATLFLASEESSFITGQTLVVDGGEVLH